MKNKILKVFLLIFILISFTACQSTATSPIEEINFDVKFNQLDLKNNTSKFIVYGYPNQNEFDQISTIIVDSLSNQEITEPNTVSVYSNFDEEEDNPFYGTAVYSDGEITKDNLNPRTEEEYLAIAI